ncbi:MAG: BLUF domain-containing protein [Rubrivivax sp.]|nr:MAG: BLUF domain-containing protein [Rubrivivax sp.]
MSDATLKAIVYVSASALPMTSEMLEKLLLDARALNRESGVTGVLLYIDGTFMQYFEGAPQAMEETYERIHRSRLHSRLKEMMNESIIHRAFPDWQMGLARPSRSELLALSTASWIVQDSQSRALGVRSVGMALLHDFWSRRPH